MNEKNKKRIKRNILKNFVKLIESKPELMEDSILKEAYTDLKKKFKSTEK